MATGAPEIDRPIFGIMLIVLLAVSIPLGLAPERGSAIIDDLYAPSPIISGSFAARVGVLMVASLVRSLREDERAGG